MFNNGEITRMYTRLEMLQDKIFNEQHFRYELKKLQDCSDDNLENHVFEAKINKACFMGICLKLSLSVLAQRIENSISTSSQSCKNLHDFLVI